MKIDFHTHIFPAKIAPGTIEYLEKNGGIRAFTDGTLTGLKHSMKESGVDISVVLPVVTKPSQFESVNQYAAEINDKDGILSFGGIHPDSSDYKKELDTIKSLGLKGIKLHPDYQKTYIDDVKYLQIIDYAGKIGLIVSVHAGRDVGLPDPIHCTPERVVQLLDKLEIGKDSELKLILAHMGGHSCWDEVEELLAGKPVYFDLSFSLEYMKQLVFEKILNKHGVDRILFATDSPWSGQKETIDRVKALKLSEEEMEKIFCQNAKKLLNI